MGCVRACSHGSGRPNKGEVPHLTENALKMRCNVFQPLETANLRHVFFLALWPWKRRNTLNRGGQGYFRDDVIRFFVLCESWFDKKLFRESWLKCTPWGAKCKSPWLWIVTRSEVNRECLELSSCLNFTALWSDFSVTSVNLTFESSRLRVVTNEICWQV